LLMGPLEKFQTGEKPYRHPLHWAAFQYYGG
jgi:CHAT domain-containing protein